MIGLDPALWPLTSAAEPYVRAFPPDLAGMALPVSEQSPRLSAFIGNTRPAPSRRAGARSIDPGVVPRIRVGREVIVHDPCTDDFFILELTTCS